MNIVKLHQKIDEWAAEERKAEEAKTTNVVAAPSEPAEQDAETETEPVKKINEKNQWVARTKTSGDRVYLIDDNNKTRQWVTTEPILNALGFNLSDVVEIDEAEFLKYAMGPAVYRLPDEPKS